MFANSVMMYFEAGKIPKMLWKMLQELGYEKEPKYFGTQITYESSESVWHIQVYIFTPSPSVEFMRWKRSMQPLLQGVLSMLGFVMLHVKHTWSPVLAIVSSWIEQSMLISLNGETIEDEMNFKLNKQVALTATLTKGLDSTAKEVEFW
jgi:hypothetical protein